MRRFVVFSATTATIALLAGASTVFGASAPVYDCTSGIAVPNASDNPGLVSDCETLLAARDTLKGTTALNWSADTALEDWHGVLLDGTPRRVTTLSLSGRGLTGEIPGKLGSLSNLEQLLLASNRLTGEVPAELGNLSNLLTLYLSSNQLTGEIPAELGGLSNLTALYLSNNQFTGELPRSLTGMTSLFAFTFFNNAGLCAPADDTFQTWFRAVHSTQGSICGTVESPEDRDVLVELYEATGGTRWKNSANWLSDRPTGEWHGVTTDVDGRVTGLLLERNGLSGPIPSAVGNLANLEWLYLSGNQLTGEIPASLGGLLNLTALGLSQNQLTGSIPAQLGNLSILESLGLHNNQLTGPIPVQLGNLSNLFRLDLQNNQLTGPIPKELGNLSNLRVLNLSSNDLRGEIPVELESLSKLQGMWLSGNQLIGCLPWLLARNPDVTVIHDGLSICPRPTPIVREGETVFTDISDLVFGTLLEGRTLDSVTVGAPVNGEAWVDDKGIAFRHDGSETTAGSFSYTVSSGAESLTGVVTVNVTPVNDPPVVSPDTAAVDEGDNVTIETASLLLNDTDAEYDELAVTGVSDPVNGSVGLEGTTVTYRHNGSETTADSFSYTVSDGVESVTGVVTVNVTPVNDPPVASPDAAAVDEGDTVTIETASLLLNDTDAENHDLTVTSVSDPVNGSVRLEDTTVTYQHDGSETNSGSFFYTVSDGVESVTGVVMVNVTPVNDPPVAYPDAAAVDEGDAVTMETAGLLRNDTDAENDELVITGVSDPVNGSVRLDGATVAYHHDGSETVAGSFSYTVSDGVESVTEVVTVDVTPVNDPPVAYPDAAAVDEGDTVTIETASLLLNDTDAENDDLDVTGVSDPVNGSVRLDGAAVTYHHDGSETTSGSFSYTVSDGVESVTEVVTVDVTPVNDPPVAYPDAAAVDEGDTFTIETVSLLRNDTDAENDDLAVTGVSDPVNGSVRLDGAAVTYHHDGSETVTGSFSYTVSDGVESVTGVVTVDVTLVNDPPVAYPDTADVDEGSTVAIETASLLRNDTDAENDELVVTGVSDPVNGSVRLDGATVTYHHDGSETTAGSFSYTVSDGAAMDAAEVQVTVRPVNDPTPAATGTAEQTADVSMGNHFPVRLALTLLIGAGLSAMVVLLAIRWRRSRTAPGD